MNPPNSTRIVNDLLHFKRTLIKLLSSCKEKKKRKISSEKSFQRKPKEEQCSKLS
jgi:hypothetical protein